GPRAAYRGRAGVHRMTFEAGARAALSDAQLRGALRHATTLFAEKRRAAMATAPDWEGARDRARAIKDETLLHLDRYLDQFTGNAERAGARTHWARDDAEACEIIGRIAEERGARTIVKSKSMATEEVHLNAALGHGPGAHGLSVAAHRSEATPGRRGAGGAAHRAARQRPIEHAGGSGHAAGARVHSLRGMSQRLPRIPADRRPRVRFGVCRSDRRGVDAAADRDRAIGPLALRLEPVRRVPRRLPRQDRHPGAVAPPACSGRAT